MKKGVLTNVTKFKGKHLCQSLFFNKAAGLRPATSLKRDSGTGFSCEFCEISKNTFFTEHLWTTTFALYGVQRLGIPTATFQKHYYRLSKCFIEFPRIPSGTAKAIATFKEITNCKIHQAVDAIWAPGTDFS